MGETKGGVCAAMMRCQKCVPGCGWHIILRYPVVKVPNYYDYSDLIIND